MADQAQMKNEEENLYHDDSRDEQVNNNGPTSSTNRPRLSKPYPFGQYHHSHRYITNNIVDIPESGPLNFIEPCHEYKAFIDVTDETKMNKFIFEVIRFAAACMNSRTNGTIHFGIGDKPHFIHGQVLGVVVEDKEAYLNKLKSAIDGYFEQKHKKAAQMCIKPPRFVEVLNRDITTCDKFVMEVDIVPDSKICEENIYYTSIKKAHSEEIAKTKTKLSKQLFVRDGGSTRNLLAPNTSDKHRKEYSQFIASVAQRSQLRKQAEEKHLMTLGGCMIKSSTQGCRLSQMITGGSLSLDKSHFEQYVIVTNKSHPSQFESLRFLAELNPRAVLDFDPESAKHGLHSHFEQLSAVKPHLPAQYKTTEGIEDIANKLKLTRNTSWVFCNGGIENEAPSDIDQWLMDKGASIRDVISFLCRKDVLPNKRFLVIFLLLSTVSEKMDPLVETFSTFRQELRGTEQILCICDNENAFTSWKNLTEAQCGINISARCIYELSFAEVNGTVLSLFSKNCRASRFLPGSGVSKVLLKTEVELSLKTLDVLCVNQCERDNVDQIAIEDNFYRGGKASWWNFYFSEQPGSSQLIKRNKTDSILNCILHLRSPTIACQLFNLMHVPGCGGTTLAMHILWALRDRFRCAVLKDSNADFAEVADQVFKLLLYNNEEQLPRVPVLLMIDDFNDMAKVSDLKQLIEKNVNSRQVILLNCMRSESPEQSETDEHNVFIGKYLPNKEVKWFGQKQLGMEKTFYGFMLIKNNVKPQYIQGVVHNTLRSFNVTQKDSQLLAVLTLLNVYCKDMSLSFSLCKKFLSLPPKPICGTDRVEEMFGKFSNLIYATTVKTEGEYRAVKMIHPNIAKCCLQELITTHKMVKADFTNLLHHVVVESYSLEEGFPSQFVIHPSVLSLVQDLEIEAPKLVEMMLNSYNTDTLKWDRRRLFSL